MGKSVTEAAEFYRDLKPAGGQCIETIGGKPFYMDAPTFDIREIGWALSHQCRYTGHSQQFYSVAEHSVLVSVLMDRLSLGDPYEGLMHDASEAYLSDIASPWKALLPDYKKLEKALDAKMRRHFGLPEVITDGCKRADWLALAIEARQLIPSRGQAPWWFIPDDIRAQADFMDDVRLQYLDFFNGRAAFANRYAAVKPNAAA